MIRRLVVLMLLVGVSGCAYMFGTTYAGSINAESMGTIPDGATFSLVAEPGVTIAERRLQEMITTELQSRGYRLPADGAEPDLAVSYAFSVGSGQQVISSMPDYVWGGQQVVSSTIYPRYLAIAVSDYKASVDKQEAAALWQGELLSSGSSANIAELADYLVPELIDRFGQTVIGEKFSKSVYP